MKTITVHLSDKTFAEIRTHMMFKYMTNEMCGVTDAFISRLVRAIDNGEVEMSAQLKGEGENDSVSDKVPDSP